MKVFGVPLEQLTENDRKKNSDLRIPYIAQATLTAIMRDGFDCEGIFRISGNKDRVANLKETFDRGDDIDFIKEKSNPNDVTSLFKMYLRELPDPLLTYERYDRWLEVHDIRETSKQRKMIKELVESLPATNKALLYNIMHVLNRISQNSASNKMDSGNLSKTVGPNLLWKEGKGDSVEYLVHSGKVNHIVQIMIEDCEHFFPYSMEENSKYATLYSKLCGHKKSIHCMVKGSYDNEMWSCDSAGSIRIWDVSSYTPVKEIETEQGRIFTLARVDNKVWTLSQKNAKIWNADTKEAIKRLDYFTYCVTEANDKIWIGGDGKILVVDTELKTVKEILVPGVVFFCMSLDSTGTKMWAGGSDKSIRIYDLQTYDMVKHLKEGHTRRVNSIIAVGNQVWTAGDDLSIFVWDAETFQLISTFEAHAGAIYALVVCGNYVWSCSWDTNIKIWNAKTFEKVYILPNYHNDAVSAITIFFNKQKNSLQAWTSSWDKSICVWNIGTKLRPENMSEINNNNEESSEISKVESKSEEIAPVTLEEKLEDLETKASQLKERNLELQQKAKELKEKKLELSDRKEKLASRKQALDEKKKDLLKRKEELANLQADLDNPTTN